MNPIMNFSGHANKERNSKIHPTNLIFEPLKVDTQYKDLLKNATINEEGIIKLDSFYICEPKNRVIIIHPAVNNINIIDVSHLYFTHYGKQMFQEIEKEDTISSLIYIFNPTYFCKTIRSIEYHGNTYENIIFSLSCNIWSDTWINRFEGCITNCEKRDSLIHEHLCHRVIPNNPSQMYVGLNQIYHPGMPFSPSFTYYSTAKIEYEKVSYKKLEDMIKEQKIMIDEMTRKQKEIERIKLEKEQEKEQEEKQLKILQRKQIQMQQYQKKKILEEQQEKLRKIDLEKKIRRQLKDEEEIEQIKMRIKQENKTVTIHAISPSKIDEVLIGVNKLSSSVKSNNRELVEVMKIFTENICDCIVENK
jgi:hypothetical protein